MEVHQLDLDGRHLRVHKDCRFGETRKKGQTGMESFNALEWWNVHKLKYRRCTCNPISTVASEATFSVGGRVIDPYRASLGSDTVQMLICGGDWIRQVHGVKKKLKNEEFPIEVLLPESRSNKKKIFANIQNESLDDSKEKIWIAGYKVLLSKNINI
uniref:HAT C-terminal dimerisation domain-containing protein n=1 Tax=Lactuca sativa TaxID=4236 RepID=A0A9R1WXF1_LACSA|nr:hypothetical protein LSAT_V11C800409300 [Lactuca sativa]